MNLFKLLRFIVPHLFNRSALADTAARSYACVYDLLGVTGLHTTAHYRQIFGGETGGIWGITVNYAKISSKQSIK